MCRVHVEPLIVNHGHRYKTTVVSPCFRMSHVQFRESTSYIERRRSIARVVKFRVAGWINN
jgi:hypothetical protein